MKQQKIKRLVLRKNETVEEFKARIALEKEKMGENYLTQTQILEDVKDKGYRKIKRTYVNLLYKEVAA